MDDFFVTKFGNKIQTIESYIDVHNTADYQTVIEHTVKRAEKHKSSQGGFLKDLLEYSLVIDFLESLGLQTKWNKTLDIGGREGFVARFLTGEGKSNYADCIELYDYGKSLTTPKMESLYRFYKIWKIELW